jgi:hypothetical protein
VASQTLARLLDRLEELKRPSGADNEARLINILAQLGKRRFTEADALIRFHESLLFLRAYPQSPRVLRQVEALLQNFSQRVELLQRMDADLEPLAGSEASGIDGTSLTAVFSYAVARWLASRHPSEVAIDWEGYEDGARMGETLPRFIPLLEEESLVEANVPYREWLRAARGKQERELTWLISRFESLALSDTEKAELYDSLKLYLHWQPRSHRTTRTGMKLRVREIFYHDEPLLGRRDVSLVAELSAPPLPARKLSKREGEELLDTIRDTSTIRYRELHGFTYGDPAHIVRVELGRGVEFFVNGVGAEYRLPLRAYTSAFIVKNGVPIGYAEGISLFERMEVGLNIYYTFREGESAWLYARILRVFRQLLGVTAFSVDPYQIGFENEEGIESGAFWFYRKLGFRPVRSRIEKLVSEEERKIAARQQYRTPARTLRRMALGHMLFELEPTARKRWDNFQTRNLGLAVARRMAGRFAGEALKMRRASVAAVERALGVETAGWKEAERRAFENLALVLSLIPNLSRWTEDEKEAVVRLSRAKAGAEESQYLRLLRKHQKLRDEIIRLGSQE